MGTAIPPTPREPLPDDRPAEYRDTSIGRSPEEKKWPLPRRLRFIIGASLALWALIILVAWWLFG